MKFGKLEIDTFVICFIAAVICFGILIVETYRLDIEREKTEQLQIQQNIYQENVVKEET